MARFVLAGLLAVAAAFALAVPALAQWPTTCVELNDIVEAHLGNHGNAGIYQRAFGAQAEAACQNDHRQDVRSVFAWAFDGAAPAVVGPNPQVQVWPTTCVELNDIVETHLGNHGNVGIYQRAFGAGAETGCRNDHRNDVRGVFAWAFDAATATAVGPRLSVAELVARTQAAVRYVRTADDGCGSAFVLTADGYAVTNSHVLGGARQVVVGTHDGREEQAAVVANDADADLALLKLPGGGPYPFLAFGRAADLRLGEDLVILGYPLCLQTITVTRGVLSARHPGWLQTDATANPGNSGGPGLDPRGGVIGVATAKLGGGAVEGVESANFLIDGDAARRTLDDWITRHRAGSFPEPVFRTRWLSVSAVFYHTCGVRADGTLACWGDNDFGQADPPPGAFQSVSAGNFLTCGVRTDGTLACWGDNDFGQADPPPGMFQSVSAGHDHTCGVRTDGTLACWGNNDYGQADPPPGAFQSVSAHFSYTCGVRVDGTLACWGNNDYGQADPPPGAFQSVSAHFSYTCGVRVDGTLACWGVHGSGQADPPPGMFQSVSAGAYHTCGVRIDGTLACWGSNNDGQADPPPGMFQSVSAGAYHTCGVRVGGMLACWGSNEHGNADPPA